MAQLPQHFMSSLPNPAANKKVKSIEELITLFGIDGNTNITKYQEGVAPEDIDLDKILDEVLKERDSPDELKKEDKLSGAFDSLYKPLVAAVNNKTFSKPSGDDAYPIEKFEEKLQKFQREWENAGTVSMPSQEQIKNFEERTPVKEESDVGNVVMNKYMADRDNIDKFAKAEFRNREKILNLFKSLSVELTELVHESTVENAVVDALKKYEVVFTQLVEKKA